MIKILHGDWLSWELAKDKYNIEPSQVSPECVDYFNHRIFVGRVYDIDEVKK